MTEKEKDSYHPHCIAEELAKAEVSESGIESILRQINCGTASKEAIKDTENYLKGYKFCKRLLNLKKYEKKYTETLEWERKFPAELTLAKAKMFEIRHFILGLPNSDEKMLLYFHYIRGDSIEKCGELLGVSRATAFRLRTRALQAAHARSLELNLSMKAI